MTEREISVLPPLDDQILSVIRRLGDYDDPCFFMIRADADNDQVFQALQSAASDYGVELTDVLKQQAGVWFTTADVNAADAVDLASAMAGELTRIYPDARVSVFRHNPIGNAQEAAQWCLIQLNDLIAAQDEAVAVNDYTDRAHWPGIDRYRAISDASRMPPKAAADDGPGPDGAASAVQKDGVIRTLFSKVSSILSTASGTGVSADSSKAGADTGRSWQAMAKTLLEFEVDEGLESIAPFIFNLPNGQALWQYVLSGEGREALQADGSLIDLDQVLVFAHAKQYAPMFYTWLNLTLRGVSHQSDIHSKLHKVLACVSDELLEEEDAQPQRRECYLRIIDIFVHILDQTPLTRDMYIQLVEDEDTAFMTAEEYQQRFQLEAEATSDGLTGSQQEELENIIEVFEDYRFADNENLKSLERLRDENRNVVNPEFWDWEANPEQLLLAAIFLAWDFDRDEEDEFTEALEDRFDAAIVDKICTHVAEVLVNGKDYDEDEDEDEDEGADEGCDTGEQTNEALLTGLRRWLEGDHSVYPDLLETMRARLDLKGYESSRSHVQPAYEALESDPVLALLAACFWRRQAGSHEASAQMIQLFMALAPQATLSCLSRLYRDGFRGFASDEAKEAFLTNRPSMHYGDEFVFNMRMSRYESADAYEKHIRDYISTAGDMRMRTFFNEGLSRLFPPHYQSFFSDVWRRFPDFDYPFDDWADILISATQLRFPYQTFAAMLARDQVLYAGEPAEYNIPMKAGKTMQRNAERADFAVLRHHSDHLEVVLMDAIGKEYEDGEYIGVNNIVIVAESVTDDEIFRLRDKVLTYTQRSQLVKETLQRFINADISYAEYAEITGPYVDTAGYRLYDEHYNPYVGEPLPMIRMEKNKDRQLRFIKVMTADPRRKASILKDIGVALYVDAACQAGTINPDRAASMTRKDLSIEDINPMTAMREEIEQQLAALN